MGGLSHTVSGDIASFRTPSRVPIESLKFHFLPKQAAGTPSPENPIPIEGWTGLNGRRAGKNLIKPYYTDVTTIRGLTITPTEKGVKVQGTATAEHPIRLSTQDVRFLDLGRKYTFSLYLNGDISGCKDPYLGYHTGETYKSLQNLDQSNNYKFTWTVPDAYANASAPWFDMYIRVLKGSTVNFEIGLQMEAGSNATDYEPYSEEQIPITFPDGETIYGGYVNPVAGEIVCSWRKFKVKDYEWAYRPENHRFQIQLASNEKANAASSGWTNFTISDSYKASNYAGYANLMIASYGNNNIYIRDDTYEDADDFVEAMGEVEIAYELANPIHIPVPAEDMKAFLDHNNFWSDANDITEVTYAVTESKDILGARKLIMDGSQPHLENASGTIASFSTDMKAPVKELKAYFIPVQEGSGDPSLANERPISGYTGMKMHKSSKNVAKFSQEILNADRTQGNITFHALSDSSVHIEGTATQDVFLTNGYFKGNPYLRLLKAGTYTFTSNFPNSMASGSVVYMYGYDIEGNNLGTFATAYDTKSPEVFTLQKDAYVNIQMIVKSGATINHDVWVQIEPGSTKTNYEQHTDEIIPIEFPVTKNLVALNRSPAHNQDKTPSVTITKQTPDELEFTTGGTTTWECIRLFYTLPAGTYTAQIKGEVISGESEGYNPLVSFYKFGDPTPITAMYANAKTTFTINEETMFDIRIFGNNSTSVQRTLRYYDFQVERGSKATAYEPYRTVYGGYVDLVRGKIYSEWTYGKISDYSWSYDTYNGSNVFKISTPDAVKDWVQEIKVISDVFKTLGQISSYSEAANREDSICRYISGGASSGENRIFIKCSGHTAVSTFLEEYGDYHLCYKLAVPNEYDLTPQQLKTLKGLNNIWSDTNGDVDVKYWTH